MAGRISSDGWRGNKIAKTMATKSDSGNNLDQKRGRETKMISEEERSRKRER